MSDLPNLIALSAAGLVGLAMASAAALKGWHGWLEIRRLEITGRQGGNEMPASPTSRIELADLKERVRKLEGIAAGVDL